MELWDAYDKDENKLGFDLVRGEKIPKGFFHLVCEVVVKHTDGTFLLMQRDWKKAAYPGYFEATAGGSALKGESPLQCIKRELFEETGILEDDFVLVCRNVYASNIFYTYFVETSCAKDSIKLQDGETIAYKWIGKDEFRKFINSDKIISHQKERFMDYYKKENLL